MKNRLLSIFLILTTLLMTFGCAADRPSTSKPETTTLDTTEGSTTEPTETTASQTTDGTTEPADTTASETTPTTTPKPETTKPTTTNPVTTTAPTTTAPEDYEDPVSGSLVMWTGHGFDKLSTEMSVPSDPVTDYTVTLAKNETEGMQIAIRTDCDTGFLNFKVLSGNNTHITVNAYHVMEILELDGKKWTDPAAPLASNKRFKLAKDETMAILVEFKTTVSTPEGDYEYELGVTDLNGNVIEKVRITVHVWNFSMPEKPRFQSAVGNHALVYQYDMLLEHNLSGSNLPYDILDDKANAYMSDPRVTTIRIPVPKNADGEVNTDKLLEYYGKIKSNPEWFSKAYFYPIDEPSTKEDLEKFEAICKQLRELCPDIRITVPFYTDVQVGLFTDQIDFMDKYVDIHCPKLALWDEDQVYDKYQMWLYDPVGERMKAFQKKGETVWSYVCNYPLAPYLNVKVDDEGIESRVLFWQFYQRDIEGFLYWHSADYSHLGNGGNPWDSVDTFQNGIYGDGILIYTGTGAGLPSYTPIASIRLKIIRDGIDDIELLYMAEELFGREWVDERANKVSKSLISVDVSSDEFAALRLEIGNAVEKELNK